MPRPRKWRKVCCLPGNNSFGPVDANTPHSATIAMTVDEYETIRLIDHEDMTQEECSEKMHIARTTVQGIYASARKKLADSLVNGTLLLIEGGDYRLCDGGGDKCGHGGCRKKVLIQEKSEKAAQNPVPF